MSRELAAAVGRALAALDSRLQQEREEVEQLQALVDEARRGGASDDSSDGERALGEERSTSDRSPSVDVMDMARVMEDRADFETAATLCLEAYERRRSFLGEDHPRTQAALRKLASLKHDAGDVASAEPLYREVLRQRTAALGASHPRTLSASVDVAMALAELGELEEAEERLRLALHGQLSVIGRRHPETLWTIGNLADVLREQGRVADAIAIFGDVLRVAFDTLGKTHLTTLVLGAKAARLRYESAREAEDAEGARVASAQLWQVVQSMREALGRAHPQTVKYAAVVEAIFE